MQKVWSYKNYQIKEGLKPGSSQFRYFFAISESGEKKCHYCVWIVDEALSRFDQSGGDTGQSIRNGAFGGQIKIANGRLDKQDIDHVNLPRRMPTDTLPLLEQRDEFMIGPGKRIIFEIIKPDPAKADRTF